MADKHPPKINHELDAQGSHTYIIRTEPIRDGEILYDKHGKTTAIKSNGKILPIIEGDL